MKKVLVVMLMAVAFAMPSNAQVKFGVTGGLNMTNVSVKDAVSNLSGAIKSRAGFFIGPTVKFTLPLVGLGVDAAAVYDQREGKAVEKNFEQTIKSQSIQIPINLRYGVGLGDMAEVFLFAGPQFGFNVGSDKKFNEAYSEWTLKSSNFSCNAGFGLTVLSHLQAKFNYNWALGKTGEFNRTLNGAKETLSSAKFNCWQISLAYWF
jgi:opacity protein-like surface antigen